MGEADRRAFPERTVARKIPALDDGRRPGGHVDGRLTLDAYRAAATRNLDRLVEVDGDRRIERAHQREVARDVVWTVGAGGNDIERPFPGIRAAVRGAARVAAAARSRGNQAGKCECPYEAHLTGQPLA